MKIIDKTPLVNEKGELGVTQRFQGMLKYGFSWPTELEAQKAIVTFFDRQLEKGYTLIRNMTLGASGITVPMILLGPAGIYVIHVTYLRGRYEAKGTAWNEESGNAFKPASVNLIQQTARMAAAVKAFIERQGVRLPVSIEPVLIAANPIVYLIQHDWRGIDVQTAETMAFVTLSLCELFRAYTVRSERASLFKIGVFSNRYMQYAVGLSIVLLVLVVSVPFLQPIFNTHFPSPRE